VIVEIVEQTISVEGGSWTHWRALGHALDLAMRRRCRKAGLVAHISRSGSPSESAMASLKPLTISFQSSPMIAARKPWRADLRKITRPELSRPWLSLALARMAGSFQPRGPSRH